MIEHSLDLVSASGPRRPWSDDERIDVARLAALPKMTLHRLRHLLGRRPDDAVEVAAGRARPPGPLAALFGREPALAHAWRVALEPGPEAMSATLDRHQIRVIGPADEEWPEALAVDPAPPSALFVRGRLDADRRRVGVVGTRNPTAQGITTAVRFGHELSAAGISIVSGLALGIDGAAHRGALAVDGSAPVGVVANGLDAAYPRRHAALWVSVATAGALVSEWPPGVGPDAFRFPLRNRIIAALSEVLVVVESRERGGSLLTARDAAERGVEVMAVPGAPESRASLGTNRLVQDGAALALEPADVLDLMAIDHSRSSAVVDRRPAPSGTGRSLLDVLASGPSTIERLAASIGEPLGPVAVELARLERDGWVFETDGWFEALDVWAAISGVGHGP